MVQFNYYFSMYNSLILIINLIIIIIKKKLKVLL